MILLVKYYSCDNVKKYVMGCASGTYGGQGKCMKNSDGGNLKEIDNLEDVAVNGRILQLILTFRRRNFLLNFSTPCI